MIKDYYHLAKPGIIYGNALAATAGFFFGTGGVVEWGVLLAMLFGLSGIIGCGCVLNNIIDREMDARMERTKTRAMVQGSISVVRALMFAAALGALGVALLLIYTNDKALTVALVGLVVYVCLYTPLKSKHPSALFVGAVAGAVPPVVGYAATTGSLDYYALLLFVILYLWQLPHFLAIATYRYDEYQAAGVPLYIKTAPTEAHKKAARKIFRYSLVVLLVLCVAPIVHTWIR